MARTTNATMMTLEASTLDHDLRFALNWARCQYGNATARAIATLAAAGFEIKVGQFGNGFWLNGKHVDGAALRSAAYIKGRDQRIGGE